MKRHPWVLLLLASAVLVASPGTADAMGPPPASKPSKISFQKAESIALDRVRGGVVEEIEREVRGGRLVYEVEVRAPDGREHEITIDADDGRILAEEIDD